MRFVMTGRCFCVVAAMLLAIDIRHGSAQETAKADVQESKSEVDPAHAEKMQEGLRLFKSQVRGVLIESCVECHGGGEVESGFDLATRKGLVRGGAHGPAVIPGKAGDSNVVRFISHKEKPYMPAEADKLPAEQIAAISRWIISARLRQAAGRESARSRFLGKQRGAGQGPRVLGFPAAGDAPPPAVKHESWVRNPIDRFVLAKLEEKGLTPSQPADGAAPGAAGLF